MFHDLGHVLSGYAFWPYLPRPLEEVRDETGFDFDTPPGPTPVTPSPGATTLALMRTRLPARIRGTYPQFVRHVFGDAVGDSVGGPIGEKAIA